MSRTAALPPRKRVFIVEDDVAVRESLTMMLENHGLEAHGFGDGVAFFIGARPAKGDVVLLDLALPGISGTEIAELLKSRGCQAEIAVISGLRAKAFDENVKRIGPIAAFRKPLDHRQLLEAILPLER
jgi:FixJ family two-component response regulator